MNIENEFICLFPDDLSIKTDAKFIYKDNKDFESIQKLENFVGKRYFEADSDFWFSFPNSSSHLSSAAWGYFFPSIILASFINLNKSFCAVDNILIDLANRSGYELGLGQDIELYNLGPIKLVFVVGWLNWLKSTGQFEEEYIKKSLVKIEKLLLEVMPGCPGST